MLEWLKIIYLNAEYLRASYLFIWNISFNYPSCAGLVVPLLLLFL